MYSHFDKNHWAKVLAHREAHKLPASSLRHAPIEHQLLGAVLFELSSGRKYEVKAATRDWDQGWFTNLTLESEGRLELVVADASPFCGDSVQARVQSFSTRFKILN